MSVTRKLRAKIGTELHEIFIELKFDVKKVFGRARAPLRVSINGYSYRSTVSVYGGRYYLPVRRSHREAAGVKVGDTVSLVLETDTSPRVIKAPPELARALAKDAKARAAWIKLSYSHKREHADAIRNAKKPETRVRRVKRALAMLAAR